MTAFPQVPLGQKCELQLNGTWTDITGYTAHEPAGAGGTGPAAAQVTWGRADEMTTSAMASQVDFRADNTDGRFTSRMPTGAYYPWLRRGTLARWSVPAASTYLRLEADALSYASCPDAAGLHVTGDLDVRADVRLTNWTGGIIAGKWVLGGSANSWLVNLNPDGTLTLFWSTTGADILSAQSAVPLIPQVTATARFSVRVTLDVNNGASGRTVTWYTGAPGGADGSTWTQLGPAVVQSGTTSIFAGTGTGIAAGNYVPGGGVAGMLGSIWELEVRSGIGGTVVAHPVFSAQTAGAASFADAAGNTWTAAGTAELSARDYRVHGALSSLPVTWGPTGQDVWAPLTASGPLRRMGQGELPVLSAMRRAVQAQGGTLAPAAYWPAEDLPGATAIASGIGGPAMTMTAGSGDGTVSRTGADFGADSSFAASLPLPQLANSAWLGVVPAYSSNGSLIVRFLMDIQTAPVDTARIMRVITTGTCREWVLIYHTSGGLEIAGFSSSGAGVFTSGTVAFGALGTPMWVSMELRPGGGSTVDWSLATLAPGAGGALGTSGTFTGSIGNATQVQPGPTQLLGAVGMGHISVQSDWQSLFGLASPLNAWMGEAAATRFARLCGENSLTSRIIGPPSASVAMGAQVADTVVNLLQSCEDADQGQVFEPRQVFGLGYRTSASMCDQGPAVSLDYSQAQLAPPLAPVDDDQRTVNDVTVTNADGSSARATLDDGSAMSIGAVGDYSATPSVVLASDSQLPDAAGWRLHVGTVNEARFPGISVNLADSALSSLAPAVRAAYCGDYIAVANTPGFLAPGPVRQLAWGGSEQIGDFCHLVTWNAVPESPWETAIAGDAVLGHADTDGSTLHANITSSATTMQVDTTLATSPLWTTAGGDFPFDVRLGGEQVTVTAITGSSPPQAFTIVRSVNGVVKAHAAGEDVRLAHPMILALA